MHATSVVTVTISDDSDVDEDANVKQQPPTGSKTRATDSKPKLEEAAAASGSAVAATDERRSTRKRKKPNHYTSQPEEPTPADKLNSTAPSIASNAQEKRSNGAVESKSRKSEPMPSTSRANYRKDVSNDPWRLAETYKNVLTGLQSAVLQSRLPIDKMTANELACFPDITSTGMPSVRVFLNVRNNLLQMWIDNPKVQLTFERALELMPKPYDTDRTLVQRVRAFLERHGFINFGVFQRTIEPPVKKHKKVIVIGAGIAGLAAAQQLRQFGMDVVVLEARDRVGGRIATFRKNSYVADLGAMVVTGYWGNPITILSRQIGLEMVPINQACPMYNAKGERVPREQDERIEKEFNQLLEAASYLSHQLDFNHVGNKTFTLGEALEWIIKLQQSREDNKKMAHIKRHINALSVYEQDSLKLKSLFTKRKQMWVELTKKRPRVREDRDITDGEVLYQVRTLRLEIAKLDKQIEELQVKRAAQQELCDKLEQTRPNTKYLSSADRLLLDWHFANLEFANAASLDDISLKHWDQDDDFEFVGGHTIVKNGYSCLPVALTEDLQIIFNAAAKTIKYDDSGVEVATFNPRTPNTTKTYKADLIVCTLTLGVLKLSTTDQISEQTNTVKFEPQLPKWKRDAIGRLGFGNLNKVVLCFDRIFWDPARNLFGHVSSTTESRGEMFLFWSSAYTPVLIALIAGKAAALSERINDDLIVGRCMNVLKGIFGNVPTPKETLVTRWRSDPWARGSYSFVTASASGCDYDLLAAPVIPPTADDPNPTNDSKRLPRMFFAGEHTIRNYPATVHGAYLSGLREAGRIADYYLGYPEGTPEHIGYSHVEAAQAVSVGHNVQIRDLIQSNIAGNSNGAAPAKVEASRSSKAAHGGSK